MARRKQPPVSGPSLFDGEPEPPHTDALTVAAQAVAQEAVPEVTSSGPFVGKQDAAIADLLAQVPWAEFDLNDGGRIRHRETRQCPVEFLCGPVPDGRGIYWHALDMGLSRTIANVLLCAVDNIGVTPPHVVHTHAAAVRRVMLERMGADGSSC